MSRKLAEKLGLKLSSDTMTDEEIEGEILKYHNELAARAAKTASNEPLGGGSSAGSTTGDGAGKTVTVAASTTPDPIVLDLVRDNRSMKLQQLITSRKATPAEVAALEKRWAGDTLSLSAESTEAFDSIIASYSSREPIRELSGDSKTGGQVYDKTKSALGRAANKINDRNKR